MVESKQQQNLRKFKKFHKNNPELWDLFQEYALDLIKRGHSSYGVRAIIEVIRWRRDVQTVNGFGKLKISNDYFAYYARLFSVAYPEHRHFFKLKKLVSMDRPADKTDDDYIDSRPAEGEEILLQDLKALAFPGGQKPVQLDLSTAVASRFCPRCLSFMELLECPACKIKTFVKGS